MARQTRTRDHRIHLKNYRATLEPRREPYWRQLGTGRYLGYRKTETGAERWIARFTDEAQRFHYQKMGPLSEHSYDSARKEAETWFAGCDVGTIRSGTVEEACRDYVDNRRIEVSEKNAADAEKRFKSHLYGTGFGRIKLDALRSRDVERWRNQLLAKSTPEHTKRTFKVIRAALNLAFRRGEIPTDAAWKRVQVGVGDLRVNALDFYWTMDDRRAFLDECPPDLQDFLTAISHTAARPQEIANAKVEDFDAFSHKLVLRHRKGHQSRLKERAFSLSNDAAFAFFRRMARDKTPKTPLITRADGSGWYTDKDNPRWIGVLKRIRREHRFDDRLTSYHFRHWTITDWLNQGIVAANVATIAGTSIDMIDQYYKKFVKGHVDDQLAGVETI